MAKNRNRKQYLADLAVVETVVASYLHTVLDSLIVLRGLLRLLVLLDQHLLHDCHLLQVFIIEQTF